MKQKRKRCNGWPLVRRPDGGLHEWLIWACEREGTPTEAKVFYPWKKGDDG
jgi:hypothetical protein